MGRIDEALRRNAQPITAPTEVAAGDVFASAWGSAGHVPGASPAPAPAVQQPEHVEREVRPHGGHEAQLLDGFEADWRDRLSIGAKADPMLADQFRRLAGTLLRNPNRLKSVLITSASPGDGKTLTALNLALALSELYHRRVLLIEGDLRRPAIAEAAGLPKVACGLTEVLKATTDRKAALLRLTEYLTLMPAGRPDPDPLSGLTSPRFQHLMQEAVDRFDWVIVDAPPLGAAPDASLMLPQVDAALLVVRARTTPHALVQKAIETLTPERILGVILNAVSADALTQHDRSYGYYYGPKAEP